MTQGPPQKAEPGTLDAIPGYTRLRIDDIENVRKMCQGEVSLTCDYTRVEENGDGTMTLYYAANEGLILYSITLPMRIAQPHGQAIIDAFKNADPATRDRLVRDLTDRKYARDTMQTERNREAVLAQAKNAAARAVAPQQLEEPSGSITGLGLRRRFRGWLGGG